MEELLPAQSLSVEAAAVSQLEVALAQALPHRSWVVGSEAVLRTSTAYISAEAVPAGSMVGKLPAGRSNPAAYYMVGNTAAAVRNTELCNTAAARKP